MSKKVISPSGEAVSFEKAFSKANSRKHFFLLNGKIIQCYTGYPGNKDYCTKVFKKAQTVYGPIPFVTAKRLAKETWPIVGGIDRLTINSYAKFKKGRK